jgi:hypothetical protein
VKVTQTIATGVFLGWLCQSSMAVQPPCIDRPSPPPCCADGQCFASPLTYGYYDTRWRRWPMECMAQASTGKPAALSPQLQREIAPFVTTPAEQEDRKAPPPSVPAGEQTPAGATGGAPRTPGGPTNSPGTPPPAGGTNPPSGPPRGGTGFPSPGLPTPPPPTPAPPPSGTGTAPATTPLYKSVSPDSPLNRTGPMGDADPPPSLPFGPAIAPPIQPAREVSQQPTATPHRSPSVKRVNPPSSDPPPAPPIALASYQE